MVINFQRHRCVQIADHCILHCSSTVRNQIKVSNMSRVFPHSTHTHTQIRNALCFRIETVLLIVLIAPTALENFSILIYCIRLFVFSTRHSFLFAFFQNIQRPVNDESMRTWYVRHYRRPLIAWRQPHAYESSPRRPVNTLTDNTHTQHATAYSTGTDTEAANRRLIKKSNWDGNHRSQTHMTRDVRHYQLIECVSIKDTNITHRHKGIEAFPVQNHFHINCDDRTHQYHNTCKCAIHCVRYIYYCGRREPLATPQNLHDLFYGRRHSIVVRPSRKNTTMNYSVASHTL